MRKNVNVRRPLQIYFSSLIKLTFSLTLHTGCYDIYPNDTQHIGIEFDF
jgi:hypothetical protein